MQELRYAKVGSVDDAVAALQEGGPTARVLAGGTDIIVQARARARDIDLLVDVKGIDEVMQLSFDADGGLTVGAATPCYQIYGDAAVREHYPALIDCTTLIGGTGIQGRASLGGNLCNSSPSGDSLPVMYVLEATAELAGPGGRRTVPAEDFCTGPGRNVMQPGEFLVSLHFPPPAPNSGASFLRFIPRNEMDIAVVNAATQLRFNGDAVSWARVSIGATAPTPLLVPEAAAALVGRPLSDESIAAASAASREAARPIADMRGSIKQRKHLAAVYTQRTIAIAADRARG
ncbi:MAG: xanthine dehydrogenase family protein subunit M [Chloroflexota bacterium]|nr:xanthine dehydrogenase family protein subunit M [Chloroflexota bacterium]